MHPLTDTLSMAMDNNKHKNLAWIAVSAIKEEEHKRGQLLITPQLVETTINLMMHTVRNARRPR